MPTHEAADLPHAAQVSFEVFGEQKTYDLIENGGEVAVTAANREEYVRLYVSYLLEGSIARQFAAFQRGFHSVCGGECLQLFRCEQEHRRRPLPPRCRLHRLQAASRLSCPRFSRCVWRQMGGA